MKPWWEKWEGRLEFELEALGQAEIPYVIKKKDKKTGILDLSVTYTFGTESIPLNVSFPPTYPYTRFEVFAPTLQLPHHQNPFSKVLCLIGRATVNWSSDGILADFLVNRMPQLLLAGRTSDAEIAAPLEEHQAEPGITYLPYKPFSVLLIDGNVRIPDQDNGTFRVKFSIGPHILKGVVTSFTAGPSEYEFSLPVKDEALNFSYQGNWYRSDSIPKHSNASEFLSEVSKVHKELQKPKLMQVNPETRISLCAFQVPDEIAWRSTGSGWIFVLRTEITRKGFRFPVKTAEYIRANPAGRSDMNKRIPELASLSSRTIVQVGLGCVGAPCAIEFARAGVGELRIMDDDFVDAATTVRWPLGLSVAGYPKAQTLKTFIENNYPYTNVDWHQARMGAVQENGGPSSERLDQFLSGADIIVDATAEVGITSLLSSQARELKVPFVALSATSGGWGGRVLVIRPDSEACYDCFEYQVRDGVIRLPPSMPDDQLNIPGCADPTFTAAGFDTSEVSLSAARVIVSLLTRNEMGGYPALDGDVFILSLRSENGTACFPSWTKFSLTRHPECQNH